MFPRGTLCDPQYQYDPNVRPGEKGSTLDPQWRRVLISDVADLKLNKLGFNENGVGGCGAFSSLYHSEAWVGD